MQVLELQDKLNEVQQWANDPVRLRKVVPLTCCMGYIFKRALRYLLLKEEWARLTKPRSHRTKKKHRAAAMDAKIDSAVHSVVEDYKTQMIKEMRKIMSGS